MRLKEKIEFEMVFPKEILDEAKNIFKALPSEKQSVLQHNYIIERLERKRLWDLVKEIKEITVEYEDNYDHQNMDEFDALKHFMNYHEKMISIILDESQFKEDT